MSNPNCDYCGREAEKVSGEDIYPRCRDLHHKTFYKCGPCHAWVGCHPGTDKPLGRLANRELRLAKSAAHEAFDPLWKGRDAPMVRTAAYAWLADELGIDRADCHLGMFDVKQCRQTQRAAGAFMRNHRRQVMKQQREAANG